MNPVWGVTTAPTTEPVTLEEAKDHLRVSDASEDTTITRLIAAARRQVEELLGRSLITQTRFLHLDEFPCGPVRLPAPPVASITHVKYYDLANVLQTWSSASYEKNLNAEPPFLQPLATTSYPATRERTAAVQIEYVAGYGAAADVPDDIRCAILLVLSDLFAHRTETITGTIVARMGAVKSLLAPYVVRYYP